MPFVDYKEIIKYLISSLPPTRMLMAEVTDEDTQKVIVLTTSGLKEKYPTTPTRMVGIALVGIDRK